MTDNSLRAHRVAELTAAIHDLTTRISAHRLAHPGVHASRADLARWKAVGANLVAEREALQAERTHETAKAEAGAPC
jgi:hypothetical protein